MNILNVDIRGKHIYKIEKIKPNIACKEIPFGLFCFKILDPQVRTHSGGTLVKPTENKHEETECSRV